MRLLLLLLLAPALLRAQAPAADPVAAVDSIFRWAGPASPGCAIGVARDGRTLVERGYGMANLEHDIPITPATVFEAGSVSKQFTAAAVALLARDGRLSLDDPIRKHLPELPAYTQGITIRQMLSHTSGFRDWGSVVAMGGWPRGTKTYANAHALEVTARQRALNHAPGAEYIYSNTNYNLAAILVERLGGMSFAEFTRQRLFVPLGMTRTEWRDDYNRIVKGRATAYAPRRDGIAQQMPFENVHGNGGLLTTVGDLLRWNEALTNGTVGGAGIDFVRELETPARLTSGRAIGYALGLTVGTYKGTREVAHGGATAGYRAYLARYPEQRLSVALLCNSAAAPTTLASRVADLFLAPAPQAARAGAAPATVVTLPPAELAGKAGVYRDVRTGVALALEVRGAMLGIVGGSGALQPLSPTRFTSPGGGTRAEFTLDRSGRATGLVTVADGDSTTYERLEPFAPTAAALAAYAGRYVSDEAGGVATFVVRDGKLVAELGPGVSTTLAPAYRDGFGAPGLGFVQFVRNGNGEVTALTVGSERARGVVFERR